MPNPPPRCSCAASGSGPFASRVVEAALAQVFERSQDWGSSEGVEAGEALQRFCSALCESLFDVVTSKHGSFIARRFLTLAAGRDVSRPPAQRGAGGGEAGSADGEGRTSEGDGTQDAGDKDGMAAGPAPRVSRVGGLTSKLSVQRAGLAGGEVPLPDALRQVAETVLSEEWVEDMANLRADPFAGPFLQALLRACQHDE